MNALMKALGSLDAMTSELRKSKMHIAHQDRTGDLLLDSIKWPAGLSEDDKRIHVAAALGGHRGESYERIRQQIRSRPELKNHLRVKK
ncbi:hypothetical protein SP695_004649 [Salmonella enterica]|nr:hypothetical protein [Salmonella enterica]